MPLYLVVILKVTGAIYAYCLTYFQSFVFNSTKFAITFLILSCHLFLGPSQNYALQTIMSIICFKKRPAHFVTSLVVETFANCR